MAEANPTLEVQVVSPERVLYEGRAEMVVCRTADGEIAFLPGHQPLLGSLGVAKVRALLPDQTEQVIAVHGGFVEVSHNRVIVLSDVDLLGELGDVGEDDHPVVAHVDERDRAILEHLKEAGAGRELAHLAVA